MKLKKFVERLSLEDAEVSLGDGSKGTTEVKVDLEEPKEDSSETIDEVIEAAVEVDASESIEKDLDKVKAVTVALEQYGDILTQSLARGGLRPEEGQLLNVALEHFDLVLGLESQVLSMEDFGGKMSRREATRVSLENVGDKLKAAGEKIWELIKELFKKLTEAISGAKAKSEKLHLFFEDSAKIAKEPVDDAVKADKFEITLPALVANVGNVGDIATGLIKTVDEVIGFSKEVTSMFEQVKLKVERTDPKSTLDVDDVLAMDMFKGQSTIVLGEFISLEVKEAKYFSDIRLQEPERDNKTVHVPFEEYLRLNGYTKRVSDKMMELHLAIAKDNAERHKAITAFTRFSPSDKESWKVCHSLSDINKAIGKVHTEVSVIEIILARIIRDVQKELEKRTSGKSSSGGE